ncbi:MAG: selenide, water dikinase SelD [Acidobacteria bacterium]|nr:MAG: selenide, water dikinase SelD [Acidobacteriota bacterium]
MLGKLARQQDPNVLVGFDHADDAGVYQISPHTALVQTVDFFTPIVDDPYTFGQIAATNSLSDVYAMGGRPLTALALVCFPEKGDLEILERILAGGLSKMTEAGCTVVGGHSIRDEETKFGYSVTGLIHPRCVLANSGARPGDALILTKALGTGVISTAIKKGTAKQSWIDAAVASMTALNKTAAEVITAQDRDRGAEAGQTRASVPTRFEEIGAGRSSAQSNADVEGNDGGETGLVARPVARNSAANDPLQATNDRFAIHAMTDITGFGLIGHAREMALASSVSLRIHASRVRLLEGALECVRAGCIPGGLKANRDFAECVVNYESGIPEEIKTVLFDPQTAGGLLISAAAQDSVELVGALNSAGVAAVELGEVLPSAKPLITVAA